VYEGNPSRLFEPLRWDDIFPRKIDKLLPTFAALKRRRFRTIYSPDESFKFRKLL